MSKCVWVLIDEDLTGVMAAERSDDPKEWLFALSEKLTQGDFIKVLVSLWAIWWARRRALHDNVFQSPFNT